MRRPIDRLLAVFLGRFVGQLAHGPDLAVGVGVGATHHRPFVLEDLHPAVNLAEFGRLLGPHAYDMANVGRVHFGQG